MNHLKSILSSCPVALFTLFAISASAGVAAGQTYGPDAYGYYADPIPNAFLDISTTGLDVTSQLQSSPGISNQDDGSYKFNLNQTVNFYGIPYTQARVSSNGYITFSNFATDYTNDCPVGSPDNPNLNIMPFWDDLDFRTQGNIYLETQGIAPTRVRIIQWTGAGFFADPAADVTFQVVIYEASGWIEFHYQGMNGLPGDGNSATIGIEDDPRVGGAGNALEISCNTSGVLANAAFRIQRGSGTGGINGVPGSISLALGGTQALSISVGSGFAGQTCLVLGTFSGSVPGFPYGGFQIPLNIDSYFLNTVNAPGTPPLTNSFTTLDAQGMSVASFTAPPGTTPALIGYTFHHAAVVLDLSTGFPVLTWVTGAAQCALLP